MTLHGHPTIEYDRARIVRYERRFRELTAEHGPRERYVVATDVCGQVVSDVHEMVHTFVGLPRVEMVCDPTLPPGAILLDVGPEGIP